MTNRHEWQAVADDRKVVRCRVCGCEADATPLGKAAKGPCVRDEVRV
jgi:hypothetical protein